VPVNSQGTLRCLKPHFLTPYSVYFDKTFILGLERWLSGSEHWLLLQKFNSQQPQGGSQPSVVGSDDLFWWVKDSDGHIHKINKFKKKQEKKERKLNFIFLLLPHL